jgi:hypothetical protein
MQSISLDTETLDWMPGSPFYGPGAIFGGREVVQLKVLSDRRAEGGGLAWLVRMTPPEGKVIRIVAAALSDEPIFNLDCGRGPRSGRRLHASGNYGLNPKANRTVRSSAPRRWRWWFTPVNRTRSARSR